MYLLPWSLFFLYFLLPSPPETPLQSAWAKTLSTDYNTLEGRDLYTLQVLFEFKFDQQLGQADSRAPVMVQVMYCLRRLEFGESKKAIPPSFYVAKKLPAP